MNALTKDSGDCQPCLDLDKRQKAFREAGTEFHRQGRETVLSKDENEERNSQLVLIAHKINPMYNLLASILMSREYQQRYM